jgi:hypothetical protein
MAFTYGCLLKSDVTLDQPVLYNILFHLCSTWFNKNDHLPYCKIRNVCSLPVLFFQAIRGWRGDITADSHFSMECAGCAHNHLISFPHQHHHRSMGSDCSWVSQVQLIAKLSNWYILGYVKLLRLMHMYAVGWINLLVNRTHASSRHNNAHTHTLEWPELHTRTCIHAQTQYHCR